MLRCALTLSCLWLFFGSATRAHAADEPAVSLQTPRCSPEKLDVAALVASLKIELRSSLGATARLVSLEEATYLVEVDCGSAQDAFTMTLTRVQPLTVERERISAVDVERPARPRTFAIAIAERLRSLRAKDADAPGSSAEMPEPSPSPSPKPAVDRDAWKRLRLKRNLAIGLGSVSFAMLAIGIPLIALSQSFPDDPSVKRGLLTPGATLTAVGTVALVGMSVSVGLWSRDRKILKNK